MILGDKLFHELEYDRNICITGAVSAGKTNLAFDIASHYWRRGYNIVSNIPHNYYQVPGRFEHPSTDQDLFNTMVVVDEGGEYVRDQKLGSAITRSEGKANYFVVFAGKKLPHKILQDIIIRVRFDFWTNFGIPLILWRGKVNGSDVPYKFAFWQFIPQLIYGTYSTRTSSGGLASIVARARNTIEILAREEGQEAGIVGDPTLISLADDIAEGLLSREISS